MCFLLTRKSLSRDMKRGAGDEETWRTAPKSSHLSVGASTTANLLTADDFAHEISGPEQDADRNPGKGLRNIWLAVQTIGKSMRLYDDALPTEHELVGEQTQRHGKLHDLALPVYIARSLQVQLLLNAGCNLTASDS